MKSEKKPEIIIVGKEPEFYMGFFPIKPPPKFTPIRGYSPYPGPRMLPHHESELAARKASTALKAASIESGITSMWAPDIEDQLAQVASKYLLRRDWYRNTAEPKPAKNALRRAARSASRLIKDLSKIYPATIKALDLELRRGVQDVEPRDLEGIRDILNGLPEALLEAAKIPISSGAQKRKHLESIVADLISIRQGITGREFIRNSQRAADEKGKGRKGLKRFVHPDPLFVQIALQAIDPEITTTNIRSVLANPPPKIKT